MYDVFGHNYELASISHFSARLAEKERRKKKMKTSTLKIFLKISGILALGLLKKKDDEQFRVGGDNAF